MAAQSFERSLEASRAQRSWLGRRSTWPAVIAALVGGVALRVWAVREVGTLESDEAIVGLMAQDVLDGEFHAFFWLQYYSGTQEVLLTAVAFAFAGSSVVALKVVPIALFAAAVLVTWRIGIRTVGERGARVGAALMWIWPPFFVFHSTKARAAYGMGLLCASLAVLLVVRLRVSDSRRDAFGLGLALGCGLWATPQSLVMPIPALAWLCWRRPAALRLLPYGALGALIGSAVWLAWNLTHGFKSVLAVNASAGEGSTYWSRLWGLFSEVLPEALGVRLAFSQEWLVPAPIGLGLTALLLALVVVLFLRRPGGTEPLLVILASYPFVYAASPFTYFTEEPRYLVFLAPVPALLIGRHLAGPLAAILALIAATALSAVYLVALRDDGGFRFVGQPDDLRPLVRLLELSGDDRVFADYWIAYRVVFETDRKIVATSTGFNRNAEYDRLVRAAPDPAYVFVSGSVAERNARARLLRSGYRRRSAGGWTVFARR